MLPWIEIPTIPEKLLLAWEPPLHVRDRSRWVVGELLETREEGFQFRYFDDFGDCELSEMNMGRSKADLIDAGFAGYPAFSPSKKWESNNGEVWAGDKVREAFLRRLPHPKRPDYSKFLENYRVSSSDQLTSMQLLSITEARSPNDGFALIDPLSDPPRDFDCVLEVVGCRYYALEKSGI